MFVYMFIMHLLIHIYIYTDNIGSNSTISSTLRGVHGAIQGKIITGAVGSSSMSSHKGLHLIVPSYDGHVYIIEGVRGCAQRIDLGIYMSVCCMCICLYRCGYLHIYTYIYIYIGEHIYSTPLFDDVTNDGYLDMIVGTVNGNVLLFETSVPYHALNTWNSFPSKYSQNKFTHGVIGVSVPLSEKK